MAGNEDIERKIDWKMAGGIGGLASVILAFSINTAKDAQIALSVVDQHGAELLMLEQSIVDLKSEIRNHTKNGYTAKDAEKDFRYIERRLLQCEKFISEASND